MKIYIAGQITGLDYQEALRSFAAAEDALRKLGHEPVNPTKENGLDVPGETQPGKTHAWADYMKKDIPLLLGCEAIYLLPNWPRSKGARLEKHIADALGMLTLFEDEKTNPAKYCQFEFTAEI